MEAPKKSINQELKELNEKRVNEGQPKIKLVEFLKEKQKPKARYMTAEEIEELDPFGDVAARNKKKEEFQKKLAEAKKRSEMKSSILTGEQIAKMNKRNEEMEQGLPARREKVEFRNKQTAKMIEKMNRKNYNWFDSDTSSDSD